MNHWAGIFIVCVQIIPFVLRAEVVFPHFQPELFPAGAVPDSYPAVAQWVAACKARPSVAISITRSPKSHEVNTVATPDGSWEAMMKEMYVPYFYQQLPMAREQYMATGTWDKETLRLAAEADRGAPQRAL